MRIARRRAEQESPEAAKPPSRSDLPTASVAASATGVTPFAWIDDATLVEPGAASVSIAVVRWDGDGGSEVDAPVLDTTVGVARRLHLTATIPHVVGSPEPLGAAGGVGTSYVGAKIGIVDADAHRAKISVAPTLEILSAGVVDGSSGQRVHVGVPVSAEIDRGGAPLYASGGFFSQGIRFVGGGAAVRATKSVAVSAAVGRPPSLPPTTSVPRCVDLRPGPR